ncbi:MAG TPA: type II secretion system protein GspD [Desulfobacteraceae bacterium]|nr:type II secretion system protein GspD [Desulfobacteraceae bacterium]
MKFRTTAKIYIFCFLCVGLWLVTDCIVVYGARVAGEKGATPITLEDKQKPPKSSPVKRPPPPAVAKKPDRSRPKDIQRRTEPQVKKTPKQQVSNKRYITIDFNNVDIAVFIKFISELTGKNFVIDKAVMGKVTIVSPTRISVEEAYKVFESVLDVHGYTTVPAGKIIKIVPAIKARAKNIETRLREEAISPEDKVVTQLIPLKYADPNDLKKLFAPLISKTSVIVPYAPTGTLIVTDVLSNIMRLIGIIKSIDVEGIGAEISVVPLEYATASVLAKSLNTVFQRSARTSKKKRISGVPAIKIVADKRTNALIIFASENDTLRVKRLIKLLDKETPRGEGDIRVFYLQHASAEDLAKVMMAIPSKQAKETKKGRPPVISKGVQITADKATNSLVITANKDDYFILEDVIKKLDIPRRMVYIECLIMEVDVDKDFKLGVEWQGLENFTYKGREGGAFTGYGGLGDYKNTQGLATAALPAGFSLGVIGESITIGSLVFPNLSAIVNAYRQDNDIHILSTPQILTTDNEEAEMTVGKNVPYVTRKETSDTNTDYSTYEYKDVGITLKITPQINQERFVRLKLSQELTRLIETEGLQEGHPTTYKRSTQTTVIVKDGNTVVIGGLIDDNTANVENKVPCMGDIPLFGWFFKSVSRQREKTNLFVFLTPHIIENPTEAEQVYQEKKKQIEGIKEGVIKMYKKPNTQIQIPEGEEE